MFDTLRARAGCDVQTVRLYEREGLLPEPAKPSGTIRNTPFSSPAIPLLLRRIFLLLFAGLLLAQHGLSAAALICRHESGVAAHHLGHHVHVHLEKHNSAGSQQQDGSGPAGDNDCPLCHLSCGTPFPSVVLSLPEAATPPRPAEPLPMRLFVFADGPERPRWGWAS